MTSKPPVITVVAAVVERQDTFLVTRRLAGTHLAGLWEFPGGKCEDDESHVACLERELFEELGIRAHVGVELFTTEHTYREHPERTIRLHFRRCEIDGTPTARLGQEILWVPRADLRTLEFPAADERLIDMLAG